MTDRVKPLYKEVVFLFCGLVTSFIIGYYIWLPDIFKADPLLSHLLMSTIMHICMPAIILCYIVSELSSNISQVDKIWSALPILFCWYVTFLEWQWRGVREGQHFFLGVNMKYVFMSCIVTVWGARLTREFYKKDGYSFPCFWRGVEDYRWQIVRKRLPWMQNNRFLFSLFNLGIICCYQILLLFATSGLVLIANCIMKDQKKNNNSIELSDLVIGFAMLILIVMEGAADLHQQVYQTGKRKWKNLNEGRVQHGDHEEEHRYKLGFVCDGLFAYSRHPNFTCEQMIWVVFYCFAIDFNVLCDVGSFAQLFHIGGLFNFSMVGCILLILLMTMSTDLTEDISASKYPMYATYQKHVSRIFDFKAVGRRVVFGELPNNDWMKQSE